MKNKNDLLESIAANTNEMEAELKKLTDYLVLAKVNDKGIRIGVHKNELKLCLNYIERNTQSIRQSVDMLPEFKKRCCDLRQQLAVAPVHVDFQDKPIYNIIKQLVGPIKTHIEILRRALIG